MTNSSYVVNLFNRKFVKSLGTFATNGFMDIKLSRKLSIVVTHIYKEWNCVANKLATWASSSQEENW